MAAGPDYCQPYNRSIQLKGQKLIVQTIPWFSWQEVMERSARKEGDVNVQQLMEEAIWYAVRDDEGNPINRTFIKQLKPEEGDYLLSAFLDLIEEQRNEFACQLKEERDGTFTLHGNGVQLRMLPWTFGERNDVLRRALKVVDAQVALDLSAYERMMILACVRTFDGQNIDPSELSAWPIALGEKVLEALDRLNGIEKNYSEVLAACVNTGYDHPDLALIRLCQTFGWQPEEAMKMDARVAERLSIGIQEIEQFEGSKRSQSSNRGLNEATRHSVPNGGYGYGAVPDSEGVTRILVNND